MAKIKILIKGKDFQLCKTCAAYLCFHTERHLPILQNGKLNYYCGNHRDDQLLNKN